MVGLGIRDAIDIVAGAARNARRCVRAFTVSHGFQSLFTTSA
jgi:hypothetical protein